MNNLVTFKIYEQYFKATRDKQILEGEGFFCYIANEYTIQADWLLNNAIGGIQLQVFEQDLEKVESIIQNQNKEEKTGEKIEVEYRITNSEYGDKVCPNCGSNHIYRDEKLNGIFGVSILLLGFPIKSKNSVFHCYYCEFEWKE